VVTEAAWIDAVCKIGWAHPSLAVNKRTPWNDRNGPMLGRHRGVDHTVRGPEDKELGGTTFPLTRRI
jgi:hypothetical protein